MTTIYFESGFETGDTSDFSGSDGTVQTNITKFGSYALRNAAANYCYKTLASSYSTIYVSGFFRWSANRVNGWDIVALYENDVYQGFLKTHTGTRLKLVGNNGDTTSYIIFVDFGA